MEVLTTQGLPVVGRAAAWAELYATRMSQCEFKPSNKNTQFDAELQIKHFGPVKLARLAIGGCDVERKRNHIAPNSPRLFNFLLQAEGASNFCHNGYESELEAGDFVLCDTTLPHYFSTQSHSVTVMVRVPSNVLRLYLPTPEQFCGRRLSSATGLTGIAAAMARKLSYGVDSGVNPCFEDRVARYLLEMVSMSYTAGWDLVEETSAIAWRRRKDVIQFIEDNLRNPELSPAEISAGLKISPRYLRTVFAPGGEKMSAYILRRRLEECARQLSDPAWAGHTITEISFSWGFNSAAHFTRTFHSMYGIAPREYRRAQLQVAA